MNAKNPATPDTWRDPGDAPELTEELFERADEYVGDTLSFTRRTASDRISAPT